MSGAMSKGDREALAKLIRQREKLAKGDVDRVAAEHLAEFEQQVAREYRADDDEVWEQAEKAAQMAVADAQAKVAERCRELGIPEGFQPSLSCHWYRRGEQAVKDRVAELRKVAKTRIDADSKRAKYEIERKSVEVQGELIAGGLDSEEARTFLAAMPTAAALMPAAPSVAEIEETGR